MTQQITDNTVLKELQSSTELNSVLDKKELYIGQLIFIYSTISHSGSALVLPNSSSVSPNHDSENECPIKSFIASIYQARAAPRYYKQHILLAVWGMGIVLLFIQ